MEKERLTVCAADCPSYDESAARRALENVLAPLGGLDLVKEGMTVAIKVNLIIGKAPEGAATTHPVLVKVLCGMLRERGARVIVGDSPGGVFTPAYLKGVYKLCGLERVREEGAVLNEDTRVRNAVFEEARVMKTFTCTGWLDDADLVINFCKLKTHAMMRMTCAVKNLFGTIPGTTKPEYHMRFPNDAVFSDMLIDLNEYFKPALNICDAVDCMEGNGPTAGVPRHMGLLLASRSPYALDLAAGRLIGLGAEDVPTLKGAFLRGLAPENADDLVIALGEENRETGIRELEEKYGIPDFQKVRNLRKITFGKGNGFLGNTVDKFMETVFQERPGVHAPECVRCGRCFETCPAHAITMNDFPSIDRSKCIRCFCCQEFCPTGAMKVRRTALSRLLRGLSGKEEGSA